MSILPEDELPLGTINEQLIKREMLIISVGSSASIHLLPGIVSKRPEILFNNKFMFIETSKDMLLTAVATLTRAYRQALAWRSQKNPQDLNGQITLNAFAGMLRKRSILLGGKGGGASPEVGYTLYERNKEEVLQHISEMAEGCTGIIVIGSSGKGTGSLVTPALVGDLIDQSKYNIPFPIGILTLPFRFRKTDVGNAQKSIKYITSNNVPMFLFDYEHALNMYLYLSQKKDLQPTTEAVYGAIVQGIASVLSDLINALNWGQKCSPPIDWSDIQPLFLNHKGVGTINYSIRPNDEQMMEHWNEDLRVLMLLRTKSKPKNTNVATVIRSERGVEFQFPKTVSRFYSAYLNTERHETYTLKHGRGFTISSLVFGFDPEDIDPPLEYQKLSVMERIRGV